MSRVIMEVLFTIVVVGLPIGVAMGVIALLMKGAVSRFGRKDSAMSATRARPGREADATS